MDVYSAPEIAHLMDRHLVIAQRRKARRRLARVLCLVVVSMLVMAAMCYVGPAGAAYDPAPGSAPIAWTPELDQYAAPAPVRAHAALTVQASAGPETRFHRLWRTHPVWVVLGAIGALLFLSVDGWLLLAIFLSMTEE